MFVIHELLIYSIGKEFIPIYIEMINIPIKRWAKDRNNNSKDIENTKQPLYIWKDTYLHSQ